MEQHSQQLATPGQNIARPDRLERQLAVQSNLSVTTALFGTRGEIATGFRELLETLPLRNRESGRHLVDDPGVGHPQVEAYLQAAFFRPNEAKFSYQVAVEGEKPDERQIAAFSSLGMIESLSVRAGKQYDLGAVFGGLLGAVDARTKNLLQQGAELSSIALLGSQRSLVPDKELGQNLIAVIGQEYYQELQARSLLPSNEFQMMKCVWESYCRRDEKLRSIPVIEVDSQLRLQSIKQAPGTPETVVDLANTLTSGLRIPTLDTAPRTFLLSSSQPYAVRQKEDFLSSMICLNYPGISEVDVVGYQSPVMPSLKLFATELAKLVHAQYLIRY